MDLGASPMSPLTSERLLAILHFQTEIAKARLDLGEVIMRSAEFSQSLTHADGASVELAEAAEMVYRAATGIAATQLGLRLPKSASLSGLAMNLGESLYCADAVADPRVDASTCRILGIRSLVVVPLLHEGGPVGVLKVMARGPGAFTTEDAQALGLMSDVIAATMARATEHAHMLEEADALYRQATRDSLTGLANRALFYDRLHQALALARRQKLPLGIALLDMDDLKPINDRHGHRAGDEALRTLALRLKRATRDADTVARLGGDEFGLLLANLQDREAAMDVIEKITLQLEGPFEFRGQRFALHASLGLALYPEEGRDAESLLQLADGRMYDMKRARKAHPRPA